MNKIVLLLLGTSPVFSFGETLQNKKNVIFIMADDLRPELNCFGAEYMYTPNIDKFSNNSVTFLRTYCNIPVSGASRASLLTGTRPTRNAFFRSYDSAESAKPDKVAINDYFQSLGYHTEVRGKIFHHREDHESGWDVMHDFKNFFYLEKSNVEYEEHRKNKSDHAAPYESENVGDFDYEDGQRVSKALNDLEKLSKSNKPFFYAFGFTKPHLPFIAPQKYWDMYEGDIKLPSNYILDDGHNIPNRVFHNWGELRHYKGVPQKGPVSDEMALNLIQGYRACVSYVDALLGVMMDKIKSLGLDKNSVIILFGDHGWNLGEHSLWCKHALFENALHAPLIIYDPDAKLQGSKRDDVVEFVDIFPTVCDIAGVRIPEQCEGESLKPLMNDKSAKSKGYAISRWLNGFTLITDDNLFYTEWWDKNDNTEERMLFDHNVDPMENHNVVSSPKYTDVIKVMSNQLKKNRGKEFDKY